LVSALATGIGQTVGWSSIEFAMATIFAIIVMYDAAGVRRAAGKQAAVLNQIIDEFFEGDHQLSEKRLKELLGHTPFQVIVGCALGIVCSLFLVPSIAGMS
jgi:acid phosphatase family membrane protein YuiD